MQLKMNTIVQVAAKECGINFDAVGIKMVVQWPSLRVNKECLAT